ncbi:hypothetical protein [Helicobacter sp. 11S02629-2]|uniref:hypothetical protein n=1 Tax=Helicobacter sp. 11S02629-2 TaxID=1476195 RepID=UPI000BA5C81B|nr:hypothetical protein [Helicobacter sp. 11S02629-2]PAF41032.1 hypothetical protein BKH40_08600 [Helicobacter sp. 11S02629-2]
MIYLNDYDRKVNLGIAERVYTSKLTKGEKNLLERFYEALNTLKPAIDNFKELEPHTEDKQELDCGTLYITDIATVAGNKVGADGAYLAYDDKLFSLEFLREVDDDDRKTDEERAKEEEDE